MRLRKSVRRIFFKGAQAVPAAVGVPVRNLVRRAFPNYLTILDLLHAELCPTTYVEIGVRHGRSLSRARPDTFCVGIDPRPLRDAAPNTVIFALESDAFFGSRDLAEILGGRPVDLGFIDGMHTFEASLRDFMNLERFCAPGSVIAVHDCYPKDEAAAIRKGSTDGVWKLIVCLTEFRPDLQVAVVDVPPTGLGLVTRLDPASTVLEDRSEEIHRRLAALGYDEVAPVKRETLNLVPPDRERVQAVLAERLL